MLWPILLLTAVAAVNGASPLAYVIPIIGQSNSIGRNTGGHVGEDVSYPNIIQTSCCINGSAHNDNCSFILAQDPLHHQCDNNWLKNQSVGFAMTFARQLRASINEDDVIILVPAGIGGTGFVDDVWTAYTGRGFVQAVARLNQTFELISKNYPDHTPYLTGFLWHQGEADADSKTTDEYLNNDLIPMIKAWRDPTVLPQLHPSVPFVVGNMVPEWISAQEVRKGVFTAIQLLDAYVPFTAVASSLGLLSDGANGAGIVHFSAPSQRLFGRRYYAAWQAAFQNWAPVPTKVSTS